MLINFLPQIRSDRSVWGIRSDRSVWSVRAERQLLEQRIMLIISICCLFLFFLARRFLGKKFLTSTIKAMKSGNLDKEMIVTQISVVGLEDYVTAKMLLDYFEDNIGLVWRCRLKTSTTPPDTYPNYEIDTKNKNGYVKVEPHAFVHFADSHSAKAALDAAARGDLVLGRKHLKVSLGSENPHWLNERRRTTTPFKLSDVNLEIGLLRSRYEFIVGWRGPSTGVDFLVDPFTETCKLLFTRDTAFTFKGEARYSVVVKCNFKIEFLPREVKEIRQFRDFSSLLQLASAPVISYRTADADIEESVPFDLLDDDDPWIRTTDFTPSGAIGRCNTYRISVHTRNDPSLLKALDYLRKRRIPVLVESPRKQLRIWDEPDFGVPMADPFFSVHFQEGLSFKVLFLVNAVMHKFIINQHQMSQKFFDLLRRKPEDFNIISLKHMCSYKRPIDDASKGLELVQRWLLKNPKLLERPQKMDDIIEVRSLIITPSTAYCLPPEVELSNRVLRNYRNIADRFLRVSFMDEAMQPLNKNVLSYYTASIVRDITSNFSQQRTTMFKRVKDILVKGFYLCGRKYSFLAFSANQLRDRSAWFFAEDKDTRVRVADIKKWMGRFTNRNVAKCSARMGQCFSSTYATVQVPSSKVDSGLVDIKRNGYVFSDGIGMISADLAMEVAEKLRLTVNPPCAYQIRYAGYKGVVACWPAKPDGKSLYLRPSMKKFESNHTMLEICSWTKFQPGFLNRQIVTLLSALNVEDNVFWNMQETMVSRLDQMLKDTDMAFDIVTSSCTDKANTSAIMLAAGFKPQTEPHLQGMLRSIRAAQLGNLREKARIFVSSGRWLMGCLDELGVVEQGQCFIQVSNPSLEDCFVNHGVQFSESKKKLQVITGIVAIAKNPCLHPGDVRILEAIDVPELHHLCNCLVFPQLGDRPHTNEASGSDLDGDLYFVSWDKNLIPPSKRSSPAMEYAPGEVKELPRDVTHLDIIDFFTKNMVNESLGAICNAHVVHADICELGALDKKCIKLAELAATAVDFPKTGKIVTMPAKLKPKTYPDFMGKEPFQSYDSKKILGKLYRRIKDVYDRDSMASSEPSSASENNIPYDQDLEIQGSECFIDDAWNCKCSYDSQLVGLLGQYKVNREEEVVTGYIWSMPKYSGKKQGELKERLKHAYRTLRKEFRKVFETTVDPNFDHLSDDEKNAMYEKKASAWYQVTYHERWVKKSKELQVVGDTGKTVMLSFAWIAADYLARIKIKRRRAENDISSKPIDSLGRYLVDKI